MESNSWNSGTIECELCTRRLPYILRYTWNRPNLFGGKIEIELCSSCEKEFRKITRELQYKANKTLTDDFDQQLKEAKSKKIFEKQQLKLPVV